MDVTQSTTKPLKNRGVLPEIEPPADETKDTPQEQPEIDINQDEQTPPAARHVRAPSVRRRSSVLVLGFCAVCGALGGALAYYAAGCPEICGTVLSFMDGSFLELFLRRLLYGGAFLLAEYVLGYFAAGEWLVWALPLLSGMGAGFSLSAAYGGAELFAMVPSAGIVVALCVFGANTSGELSALLLRLAGGNGGGVIMTGSAAKDYSIKFLGYLGWLIAAALYEAAVKLAI